MLTTHATRPLPSCEKPLPGTGPPGGFSPSSAAQHTGRAAGTPRTGRGCARRTRVTTFHPTPLDNPSGSPYRKASGVASLLAGACACAQRSPCPPWEGRRMRLPFAFLDARPPVSGDQDFDARHRHRTTAPFGAAECPAGRFAGVVRGGAVPLPGRHEEQQPSGRVLRPPSRDVEQDRGAVREPRFPRSRSSGSHEECSGVGPAASGTGPSRCSSAPPREIRGGALCRRRVSGSSYVRIQVHGAGSGQPPTWPRDSRRAADPAGLHAPHAARR